MDTNCLEKAGEKEEASGFIRKKHYETRKRIGFGDGDKFDGVWIIVLFR